MLSGPACSSHRSGEQASALPDHRCPVRTWCPGDDVVPCLRQRLGGGDAAAEVTRYRHPCRAAHRSQQFPALVEHPHGTLYLERDQRTESPGRRGAAELVLRHTEESHVIRGEIHAAGSVILYHVLAVLQHL